MEYVYLNKEVICNNIRNLTQVTFEVTDACNLQCKCVIMKSIRKLKRMRLLSKEEQKLITGAKVSCTRGWPDGSSSYTFEPAGMPSGTAWCDFWSSVGYRCTCSVT